MTPGEGFEGYVNDALPDIVPDAAAEKAAREARSNVIRTRDMDRDDWYIFARKVRPLWNDEQLMKSWLEWCACEKRLDGTTRDSRGKELRSEH